MTRALIIGTVVALCLPAWAQTGPRPNHVEVHKDNRGFKLKVDGKDFMVKGMNWGYIPIGSNYRFDLFNQPDAVIKEALDREMSLMKRAGINAIRVYAGIPPKWITYIYEKYGIYTAINDLLGRYGIQIGSAYVSPINYQDPEHRKAIFAQLAANIEKYKDVPGVLMWLLGNENNYGLYWSSYEIEALPKEEQHKARAVHLYTMLGEAIRMVKAADPHHPTALTNGDLLYNDLIAEHCKGLDIMGSNVYRGASSRDLFKRVKDELDLPFVYTEFGADAYNAREMREDHVAQAFYVKALWQEIYEQSYGKGRVGNAIGGFTFQWSDGWWKFKQDTNLEVQDTNASWPNGGYNHDFVEGKNNMNEEWFGICAKGYPDDKGLYELYPRASFYALQQGYRQDAYAESTTLDRIREHWGNINLTQLGAPYERRMLERRVEWLEMFAGTNIRMRLDTFTTGGDRLDVAEREQTRFDHMQSFWLDFRVKPAKQFEGKVILNVVGNVAQNPINEIFYENRTIPVPQGPGETADIPDPGRVQVYGASFDWKADWFRLEGFYRTGHYHWGYEGDAFGLYQEANYGENIDIYNGRAPIGVVFSGKHWLEGFKLAIGPELWWGANPTVIAKYYREMGKFSFSLIHQEDIAAQGNTVSSLAIPTYVTRKSTAWFQYKDGPFKMEIGAIMAGTERLDQRFVVERKSDGSGYQNTGNNYYEDTIDLLDTLGGKVKFTAEGKGVHWYAQFGYRGLVADGGGPNTITFTGWNMAESGAGNHWAASTGFAFDAGNWQFSPNFLYQKPLEGPLPNLPDLYAVGSNTYYPGIQPRNIFTAPFVVRSNRETYGLELMITYDPTPGTWLWAWDNEIVEDAPFAFWLDFVYRFQPTSRDSGLGNFANFGFLPFGGAPPAQDVWDLKLRLLGRVKSGVRVVSNLYLGQVESRGADARRLFRGGGDIRVTWRQLSGFFSFKIDDWGPYDYHQDFNLTFPLQLRADLNYGLIAPKWLGRLYTRFGVRADVRFLDRFSPRYQRDPNDPNALGLEWEVRTYVDVTL